MEKVAPRNFSVAQRALHWLTVILVFFNLLLPGSIERVADLLGGGKVPTADEWTSANLHIYSGVAILLMTLVRFALRFMQGVPAEPAAEPAIFQRISKIAHALIYFVLIAMPISGLSKFYLHLDLAGFVHGGPLKLVLWVLIITHIGAVLVHQFYWKTNVLERMTRGTA